ncbi:hypothetical protein FACS1894151_10620 [Spirochaetia bacterium]|nr:hypothetical protein FACS1894151_10620 [Spirochaetia bacterium]
MEAMLNGKKLTVKNGVVSSEYNSELIKLAKLCSGVWNAANKTWKIPVSVATSNGESKFNLAYFLSKIEKIESDLESDSEVAPVVIRSYMDNTDDGIVLIEILSNGTKRIRR